MAGAEDGDSLVNDGGTSSACWGAGRGPASVREVQLEAERGTSR